MQLNTTHIRQGKQNPFGFMHKSKGRPTTQEKAGEETTGKSSQKIINLMEHKPNNISIQKTAVLMNILNRNVKQIQASAKFSLKSEKL